MNYKDQPWFIQLGLKEESFSQLPHGENPLIWAIQNNLLDSQKYRNWASEYYQLPRIDDSFFNFSMDNSLTEKHADLFPWDAHCYPIFEWDEILYVACLQPAPINEDQKTCFIIASLDAMESAWIKNNPPKTTKKVAATAKVEASAQSSDESNTLFADSNSLPNINIPELPKVAQENKADTPVAPDLDFSNLIVHDSKDNFSQEESKPSENSVVMKSEQEENSFAESQPEVTQFQPIEALSEDKTTEESHDEEDNSLSGLSFADLNLSNDEQEELFDDDVTPPPTQTSIPDLSHAEVNLKEALIDGDEHTQSMNDEVTQTENSQPAFIPKDKRITDEDLKKHKDLELCQGTKDILSHIFYHLTKDFQKLMWIELSETGQFFPRFVYGPWSVESTAWNHAIDVSKPNIFRIAFNTGQAFHGPISTNKVNSNYFNWWTSGKAPNHATVYPLVYDEACFGFIVAFDQGPQFDDLKTLKKVQDLVSLSSKAFASIHMKKAS